MFGLQVEILADSGFLGIDKYHANSRTPYKSSKKNPLTPEQKQFNKQLAQKRVFIEPINRRCKIFRIVKNTYRGKHKKYNRNRNLMAMIVNFSYDVLGVPKPA